MTSNDTKLHAGSNLAREDTSRCVQSSLIGGGHHLGDVHHQGCPGVALFLHWTHTVEPKFQSLYEWHSLRLWLQLRKENGEFYSLFI